VTGDSGEGNSVPASGTGGSGSVGGGTVGVGVGADGAPPLLKNQKVTSTKTKRTTTAIIIFL